MNIDKDMMDTGCGKDCGEGRHVGDIGGGETAISTRAAGTTGPWKAENVLWSPRIQSGAAA